MHQVLPGQKEILHFTDVRTLMPDVDSKFGGGCSTTAKSSNLHSKLKQTRNQANKFSFKEEEDEKAANPVFNNRILKMYDASYLTHMMMSETDPLYNS
jgi:hypothetical protein